MRQRFSEVANIPRGEIESLTYKKVLIELLGKESLTTDQVALNLKLSITNALEVIMQLECESYIYKHQKRWHLR